MPEIHQHVAGTLSKQPTHKYFIYWGRGGEGGLRGWGGGGVVLVVFYTFMFLFLSLFRASSDQKCDGEGMKTKTELLTCPQRV